MKPQSHLLLGQSFFLPQLFQVFSKHSFSSCTASILPTNIANTAGKHKQRKITWGKFSHPPFFPQEPVDKSGKMYYNIFYSGACQGCTNRGVSGSLSPEIRYMQGLIPFQRIRLFAVCLVCKAERDRSRATDRREPCQAGNRAALSGTVCVPRPTGFEPSIRVTGKGRLRGSGVQPWESPLFFVFLCVSAFLGGNFRVSSGPLSQMATHHL